MEEASQVRCPAFDGLFAGIALDDNGLVEQQLSTLSVVPPDAFALGEGGGTAEQHAEGFQGLIDPVALVDRLVGAVAAGDEEHQQRRGTFAGTEGFGEIGRSRRPPFLLPSVWTFWAESQDGWAGMRARKA